MSELIALDLDSEQGKHLQSLIEEGDEDKVNAYIAKRVARMRAQQLKETLLTAAMRDVIRNVHFCLHTKQVERAQSVLCSMQHLLDGHIDIEDITLLATEMNELNTERAKAGCEGSA